MLSVHNTIRGQITTTELSVYVFNHNDITTTVHAFNHGIPTSNIFCNIYFYKTFEI